MKLCAIALTALVNFQNFLRACPRPLQWYALHVISPVEHLATLVHAIIGAVSRPYVETLITIRSQPPASFITHALSKNNPQLR